jgi:cobalamin biosynthesis Mg chelatase CobN
MRKWVSVLAILAGLAFTEPAIADSPAEVYSDFAEDGVLSCGHSRSALKGVLNDASLHQYGDPLTFAQVKVAIRRQLTRGCRRRTAAGSARSTGDAAPDESSSGQGSASSPGGPERKQRPPSSDDSTPQAAEQNPNGSSEDSRRSGGMVLLGVGLLLLALGSAAWAARRAFGDRQ